jgi:glutathione S-transferase
MTPFFMCGANDDDCIDADQSSPMPICATGGDLAHRRVEVDLANKPYWFEAISPLGKTPVLKVGESAIFESAVILEYLEEALPSPLHPADPLRRAERYRRVFVFGHALGHATRGNGMEDGEAAGVSQ